MCSAGTYQYATANAANQRVNNRERINIGNQRKLWGDTVNHQTIIVDKQEIMREGDTVECIDAVFQAP